MIYRYIDQRIMSHHWWQFLRETLISSEWLIGDREMGKAFTEISAGLAEATKTYSL